MASGWDGAVQRRLRGEFVQAFSKYTVECWERVDHVREHLQRNALLDREYELTHDLARTGADERGADQHSALGIGDELERAGVEIVDVASRGLGRIGAGHDDVDAARPRGSLRHADGRDFRI